MDGTRAGNEVGTYGRVSDVVCGCGWTSAGEGNESPHPPIGEDMAVREWEIGCGWG